MAKTTTKSQAKTKTTKKPAAKKSQASKPAVSKKTVKSTTASVKTASKKAIKQQDQQAEKKQVIERQVKTAEKQAVVKQVIGKAGNPFAKVRQLHLFSAVIFVILAAVMLLVVQAQSYEVTVSHLGVNELASKTTTVFAPAVQHIADVDIRIPVAVMLLFSAVLTLWRVFRRPAKEQASIAARVIGFRWFDFAVSGALMIGSVALLVGITDIGLLKALSALVAVGAVFAWFAERNNIGLIRHTWTSYVAAVLSGFVALSIVTYSMIATHVYGLVRYSWFVYALFGVVLLGGLLVAINHKKQIGGSGRWADYTYVEQNYVTIGLLVKVIFAAILVAGLA